MSNKTQLQTNNTILTSLTNRVLAAKDTAAGISLGTCELTINCEDIVYSITYTTLDSNGNSTYACITPNSSVNQIITCLCNSSVAISWNRSSAYSDSINNNNIEVLHSRANFVSFAVIAETDGSAKFVRSDTHSGGSVD